MTAPTTKERYKIVVVPHLILIRDNKILLCRRCNTSYGNGSYGVVAGHLEKDESITQAMIRETKEESGLDLSPLNIEVVHTMHRKSKDREDIDIFYVCTQWEGEPENTEPEKCDDMRWFDLEDIPENTLDYIKFALECYKRQITYSEYGWN
jgi:ADP-ribose pyrophosphatase YjhB (NUDIX family)